MAKKRWSGLFLFGWVGLIGGLAFPGVASFDEEGSKAEVSPEEAVDAVLAEYQEAFQAWIQKMEKASADERAELMSEMPSREVSVEKLWPLAEANPGTEVAIKALEWIFSATEKPETKKRALAVFKRDFVESDAIDKVCLQFMYAAEQEVGDFLKLLFEKSPHRNVKGSACFAYAGWLQRHREVSAEDVLPYYEKVIASYSDLRHRFRGNLGNAAQACLYELKNLQVGMRVPDIEGQDLDGVPFRLSDYRGKVIFLDYWAHW